MTGKGSEDWLKRVGVGGHSVCPEAFIYLPLLREATCTGGLEQPQMPESSPESEMHTVRGHEDTQHGRVPAGGPGLANGMEWLQPKMSQKKTRKPQDNKKGD